MQVLLVISLRWTWEQCNSNMILLDSDVLLNSYAQGFTGSIQMWRLNIDVLGRITTGDMCSKVIDTRALF